MTIAFINSCALPAALHKVVRNTSNEVIAIE